MSTPVETTIPVALAEMAAEEARRGEPMGLDTLCLLAQAPGAESRDRAGWVLLYYALMSVCR